MTAAVYNLIIEIDADWQMLITAYDDAAGTIPTNLTGYTSEMQIRQLISDPTALVTLSTRNGGITLGGTAGTIQLNMSHTTTGNISVPQGVYDLYLVNASGFVTRILEGIVYFSPTVTNPVAP
jgi:hypothetical protein